MEMHIMLYAPVLPDDCSYPHRCRWRNHLATFSFCQRCQRELPKNHFRECGQRPSICLDLDELFEELLIEAIDGASCDERLLETDDEE
jgi:hypothetical protein